MLTNLRKFIYFIIVVCFVPAGIKAQGIVTDTLNGGHLDEVRVSATLRPSASRSTSPLQVMDSKDIERRGIQSLSDAVRQFSGVTVKDYGGLGGLKTVSIRGMGATHTAVSYDGVTVSDAQTGQVDIGRFSLDNLSMISLVIGQSDDIFQTARITASVGALNLKTESPAFNNNNYSGKVQMKVGSFGFLNPSLTYSQKFNDTFSGSVFGSWQKTDGDYPYSLKNGNTKVEADRINSDLKSLNTELNLYGNFQENGKMRLKAYYYDSERGLPGAVILYNPYSAERLWTENFFSQLHYENLLSDKFQVQGQIKYDYTYTHYIDVDVKYPSGVQENLYTQSEYYASGTILYKPLDVLSFSLAEDAFISTLWNNFEDCPFPKRFNSLTALSAQYFNSRFTATGTLLGTLITEHVESGETPDNMSRLSPSISLSYQPLEATNLRVRASYKDIFRVPTFNDLYYSRIGNRNLKPEKTSQYNLGLTWTGSFSGRVSNLMASVDGYYNRVHDKIVAIPTLFIWKMMNMGEVEAKGVDVKLSTEIDLGKACHLNISGSYSYQRTIDVTDKEAKNYKDQLPYVPEHSGSAIVTFENPWVNIGYNLIASGERYSNLQNIAANHIDAYLDQSITLNKAFEVCKTKLRVQADIQNLSNKTYEIIKWYPMPGRSYRLSVAWEF